ncbi:MAG: hypothetical protein OXN89_08650 [Bryobacterales bacterium]|nr:hypothetical protein [Bryobacterales bacterium]
MQSVADGQGRSTQRGRPLFHFGFGTVQVMAAALLDGLFALKDLPGAEAKGLFILWARDLAAKTAWVHYTSGGEAR